MIVSEVSISVNSKVFEKSGELKQNKRETAVAGVAINPPQIFRTMNNLRLSFHHVIDSNLILFANSLAMDHMALYRKSQKSIANHLEHEKFCW